MRQLSRVGIIGILIFGFGVTTVAQTEGSAPSAIPASVVQQAIDFRKEYGLDSDAETVARYEADASLSRSYGTALTKDEELELRRRDVITSSLDSLVAELEKQPAFAGIYFDQLAGGVIDVATTEDSATMALIATRFAPEGAVVRTRMVANSMGTLRDLQAAVTGDLEDWRASGVRFASVGVDVQKNLLRISVVDLTADAMAKIEAKYGPAVDVVPGEEAQTGSCVSRTNCGAPVKGGLSITGGGWVCTSGFGGKLLSTGRLLLLTAGHCLKDSGLAATWYHHGVSVGQGWQHTFFNGSKADVGSTLWAETGARNWMYASSNLDIRNILSSKSNAAQVVGATVCRSGQTSGWRCGTIAQTAVDTVMSGVLIYHMWWTNYVSAGGDSGAAMMDNGTSAMGIFSGGTSTQSIYSTIYWIGQAAGVRPCYNTACS